MGQLGSRLRGSLRVLGTNWGCPGAVLALKRGSLCAPLPRLSAVLRLPLHRLCPRPPHALGRYSQMGGSGWGQTTAVPHPLG